MGTIQARQELELVRSENLEDMGKNPWRIYRQRVRLDWQDKGVETVAMGVSERP
jgi:hypothetical protein